MKELPPCFFQNKNWVIRGYIWQNRKKLHNRTDQSCALVVLGVNNTTAGQDEKAFFWTDYLCDSSAGQSFTLNGSINIGIKLPTQQAPSNHLLQVSLEQTERAKETKSVTWWSFVLLAVNLSFSKRTQHIKKKNISHWLINHHSIFFKGGLILVSDGDHVYSFVPFLSCEKKGQCTSNISST